MRRAVVPSTRVRYDAVVERFCRWLTLGARGPDDFEQPPLAADVVNWVAHLVDRGEVAYGTIASYVSALSNWIKSHPQWARVPNPALADIVKLALKGAEHAVARPNKRKHSSECFALTPLILLAARKHLCVAETPETRRFWAMATVGCATGLRPSELCGSAALTDRRLRVAQLKAFCRAPHAQSPLPFPTGPEAPTVWPGHLELQLTASKTDQAGAFGPVVIGAPFAIEALWRWLHYLQPAAGSQQFLFALPREEAPPSVTVLLEWLREGLKDAGHVGIHVTGKCFRRGANSALVAGNAPIAESMALGRWASPAMVGVYASEAVLSKPFAHHHSAHYR